MGSIHAISLFLGLVEVYNWRNTSKKEISWDT